MADITLSIPSTLSPSHMFRFTAGRGRHGGGYISAQEGEVSEGMFRFAINFTKNGPGPGSRRREVEIPGGRLTAKAIAKAAATLTDTLLAEGLIDAPVDASTIAAAIR